MRRNLMTLLQPVKYEAREQQEDVFCQGCGAVVADRRAHSRFHEALAQLARDTDSAQTAADQASARARRGGW